MVGANSPWRSHGFHHNSGRFGGRGSFPDNVSETMACMMEALHQDSSRRRKARSRSSSRCRSQSSKHRSRSSTSSSVRRELEELRRYKEQTEAAAAATREAEKKKAEQEAREAEFKRMEERILRAFQSPSKNPAKKKTGSPSAADGHQAHEQPLSTLAARFIESLTDNHVSSDGLCSWEGVEQRLMALDSGVLREILVSHSESVPRSKPQRVSKLVEFLSQKCAP